jgi:hypothetical protein
MLKFYCGFLAKETNINEILLYGPEIRNYQTDTRHTLAGNYKIHTINFWKVKS